MDIRSRPGTHGDLEIKVTNLHNTKVGSSKIAERQELEKKRQKNKPHFRIIGLPEVIGMIFDVQTVFCSRQFTYVTTMSLENRSAVMTGKLNISSLFNVENDRNKTHCTIDPIAGTATIHTTAPAIRARRRFERNKRTQWRQFTQPQQIQIADNLNVNLSLDGVTRYSARAPELMFINSYVDFTICFAHIKLKALNKTDRSVMARMKDDGVDGGNLSSFYLADDVIQSYWINGFEEHTLIRPPALAMILDKYSDRLLQTDERMFNFFHALYYIVHKKEFAPKASDIPASQRKKIRAISTLVEENLENFVDMTYKDEFLPLPLFSSVRPSNATKFFVHILLSMGTFDTEYELWDVTSVKSAFENANLLRRNATDAEVEEDLKEVAHRYVSEQLLFVPAGSKLFDYYVCEAKKVLLSIYTTGALAAYEIPACLHTTLEASMNKNVTTFKTEIKLNMIRALRLQIPSLPSEEEFLACNRAHPMSKDRISYECLSDQSDESKKEQECTFQMLKEQTDAYSCSQISDNQNTILHGPPGVGKTHVGLLSVAYAIGQGLTCISMALLCERALLLGGMHYHKFTKMPCSNRTQDIHSVADICIQRFKRDPVLLSFARSLDLLFFDEFFQISGQQVSILDIILRWVRTSEAYMGGLRIISTADVEQLGTIEGTPVLMSANIICSYRIVDLQHYVRCREDINSQIICDLCRHTSLTKKQREQFIHLITTHCKFVPSMEDPSIPRDALRMFGTHAGADKAEIQFINKLKTTNSKNVVDAQAKDIQSLRSSMSQWIPATDKTTKALNRSSEIHEPDVLHFYPGAVMEFTHNKPGHWSQGQLCICTEVPDKSLITNDDYKLAVYLAPVGTKTAPDQKDKEHLVSLNWKEVTVERRKNHQTINIQNNTFAQRIQFPLHSRVAATIHRAMGCNLKYVVTQVSKTRNDAGYIWDRGQVVVLLSRTPKLSNIYFVKEATETKRDVAETLLHILSRAPQFYNYMKNVIDRLGIHFVPSAHQERSKNLISSRVITLKSYPFRPMDFQLPDANICTMGFTYILLSLETRKSVYIGSCNNIAARLAQHNGSLSSGKNKTAPSYLKPWALLGFICGFNAINQNQMLERAWQNEIRNILTLYPQSTIIDLVDVGKGIVRNEQDRYGSIKYQECGKLVCYPDEGEETSDSDEEPTNVTLAENPPAEHNERE